MDKFSFIGNADVGYIDDLLKAYLQDPNSVDASWQNFFKGYEFSRARYGENGAVEAVDQGQINKEIAVRKLINAYRSRGHLESDTNPVRQRRDRKAKLALEDSGLTEADLDQEFEAGHELGMGRAPLRDIRDRLRKIYLGKIGFEFMHIRDPEMQDWLRNKIENDWPNLKLSLDDRKRILSKLNESVVFENFLHTKFIGQKRFSLEGGESIIPALDAIINRSAELGIEDITIGMAHRGRLNILTNVMGKTYNQVFNEFQGQAVTDETLGSGDVKYHLGITSQIKALNGKKVQMNLAPNPSHLEAVNPVVLGYVRALIDQVYGNDPNRAMPILIHGDAAVAGQGIVYETLQMSELQGYHVGGTIHLVINNQVGFTTDFHDARSSTYCTDIGSIVEAPKIHVNADDPEAVVFAVKLAVEFRQRYHRDVFVDLLGYRKHGHNESDEPRFTQPSLYKVISKHPNPREVYNNKLLEEGVITPDVAKNLDKEFRKQLNDRLNDAKQNPLPYKEREFEAEWKAMRRATKADFEDSPETGISQEAFDLVAKSITTLPNGFKALKQIDRLISDRKQQLFEEKKLNWATAEMMAYGSILLDGSDVRFSGQDVERGTFSHRHAILTDVDKNEKYNSLNHIRPGNQGRMMIYNSLLSEYGVLGFEFGYATATPKPLVLWEAQFGDFVNGGQIMIDQFISSSEIKWQTPNGLVMLLPHGYEGQGPEHSNAHPERFLDLAAENNMIVANLTTAANLFHLLRRQLAWDFRKPCILFEPKSLLRDKKVSSPVDDFLNGKFEEVYEDQYARPLNKVEKVLLCTGKIYYDLLDKQQADGRKDVAIIRVEQLHPFPETRLERILSKYKNMKKLIWVQEEPVNMGYWTFILRTYYKHHDLDLVARKPSASPATGFPRLHQEEQEKIVTAAFER